MLRRMLGRMWGDLNLSARLMVGTGFAVTATAAALLYSIVVNDVERHRGALLEKANASLEFIVPAITEQAVIGDYSLIQQMITARVDEPNIARAGWVDNMGNLIQASSPDTPLRAPRWFGRWADLPYHEVSKEIAVGGQSYGKVFLVSDPNPTVNQLWEQSVGLMQLLLFGIGLLFSVTLVIATNGLRPLVALAQSASRFGQGDYTVRIPNEGSPEVQASIQAFNSMADSIESLLKSLNDSKVVLFEEKERAQVTLASISDAVVSTDTSGNVEYMNPVAEKLTGWNLAEARGQPLPDIFRVTREATAVLREDWDSESVHHAVLLSKDQNQCPIEHSAAPIRSREGNIIGTVLAFRDVGESRKMAHQLSWQATHDSLTGLVNRAEFERRLDALVEEANTDGTAHALLYLDLDQFKVVNDTCGHVAGDELLRQLAALLHGSIRDSDTLARLGGDEFGVLLHGCPLERALIVGEGLRQTLTEFRFAWQEKAFVIGISIGVVAIAGGGLHRPGILAAADAACYSAKDKGRNRIQAYLPDDTELAQRRGEMQWVSRLTRAFEEDRFTLYCQRIQAILDGAPQETHYEVLVRMVDEEGRHVPPMAFIPAAERYGLMPAIDRRVVALAFEACHELAASIRGPLPMLCVNVSGASLNDEQFLYFVQERLLHHRAPASMICFEITETAAIANLTRASRLIRELRQAGFKFALDDFGSGLSSFAYLKNLPVDFLKIDGSFVKDMAADLIDRAMVNAINDIGHVMGIKTIAEWVENEETLAMLRRMGVDYAQGYGIEMPRPLEQIRQASLQAFAPGQAAV
ncbi:MAG: EAL domain-containing protein [Betaproteobacteria bacterium]|nr:EAL domain-containing protein [Betaproteobacteria bacterium]